MKEKQTVHNSIGKDGEIGEVDADGDCVWVKATKPCVTCEQPIHAEATICLYCKRWQTWTAAVGYWVPSLLLPVIVVAVTLIVLWGTRGGH